MLINGRSLNQSSKGLNCLFFKLKNFSNSDINSEKLRKFRKNLLKVFLNALRRIEDTKERLYYVRQFNSGIKSNNSKKEEKEEEEIDWEHLIELNSSFVMIYKYLINNYRYLNSMINFPYKYDFSWKV